MNIEWLVANVKAVGPPDRAECAMLVAILARHFWSIQAVFVAGEPFCGVRTLF